jgi:hypothetical protein
MSSAIKFVMFRLLVSLFRRSFYSRRDLPLQNLALRQQLLALRRAEAEAKSPSTGSLVLGCH